MKLKDRVKIAFAPKNNLWSVLQQYANDFLSGGDVPVEGAANYSDRAAMSYSAVFACVRVLSETLGSCPVFEYKKLPDGNREVVSDSAEAQLLHYAPNPDMTPSAFKEFGMISINLGGNAYYQKVKNKFGDIIQLRPISYERIKAKIDPVTNRLVYELDNDRQNTLTRDSLLHIPGITIDGYTGITPLEYAQASLKVGVYQETFQQNFYKNGVMTSGVFEHPGELGDDAFSRLKKDLTSSYAGLKNTGKPMILEGGMKYREVQMKLADAQFIESKRFQIEDIARFYRVPLHLIGDLSRSTNNNIEHQSLEFIIYTMLPWFKRWEENLNLQLIGEEGRKEGRYFEFKVDAILRGDIASRYSAYAMGRQWGWLSVNDILRLENRNGIGPQGDIYLQPMNFIEAGKDPEKVNDKLLEDTVNLLKGR